MADNIISCFLVIVWFSSFPLSVADLIWRAWGEMKAIFNFLDFSMLCEIIYLWDMLYMKFSKGHNHFLCSGTKFPALLRTAVHVLSPIGEKKTLKFWLQVRRRGMELVHCGLNYFRTRFRVLFDCISWNERNKKIRNQDFQEFYAFRKRNDFCGQNAT